MYTVVYHGFCMACSVDPGITTAIIIVTLIRRKQIKGKQGSIETFLEQVLQPCLCGSYWLSNQFVATDSQEMHVQLSACRSSNCPFTRSRGARQKNPKWKKRFFVTEKYNKTKTVLLTHHVWLTDNITWSKDMHSTVIKQRGNDYSCSFSLPQMNGKIVTLIQITELFD